MSVESKEFHSGGYNGGYGKPTPVAAVPTGSRGPLFGFVSTFIWTYTPAS
jgi:hypothetical protein